MKYLALCFCAAAFPGAALAYAGPGAGLSAIGTLLAVLGAVVLMVAGFVWYPVKRMLKARRRRTAAEQNAAADGE
ncbi:hypothetical protein ACUXV3_20005 (plasmid) [Roseobacteraceae bacterium NS-SX3]